VSATATGHVAVAWIGHDGRAPQLADVCHHLEHTFLTEVRLGALFDRPRDAYDARRGQYESTRILKWLADRVPAGARSVLAVTDQDLCIVVLTYVFGEAQVGGPAAVVSTARLQQGPAGDPVDAPLYHARLVKECVHEIGHTFGLTHCKSRGCVMGRANTIHDVDAKGDALCHECRTALAALQFKEAANVP
jgi:archaemetzincin